MGYNIEISLNLLKETKGSEIESTIKELATKHECNTIYTTSETDGACKIPRYHNIIVINFLDSNIQNLINFVRNMKIYKKGHIECIYDDCLSKLIYASSYYLKTIDKYIANNYKAFIKNKDFTPFEMSLLHEFNQ